MINVLLATRRRLVATCHGLARGQTLSNLGLCICLFLTPLIFGGRHDIGRFVYILGASFAIGGCLIQNGRGISPPRWLAAICLATFGLLTLQVVPLPDTWLGGVGPGFEQWLPAWTESTWLGSWRSISINPGATLQGLAILIAHSMLLLAVIARAQSQEDIQRFVGWIAIAAIGMAVLAFVQHATSNGKLLWVYQHPFREIGEHVQGTFANQNHFAHFLILGIGPTAWMAMAASSRGRGSSRAGGASPPSLGRLVWSGGGLLLILGILASQSRGGVITLGAALLTLAAIACFYGVLRFQHLIMLSLASVLLIAGVSWLGYERIAERYDDVFTGRFNQIDEGGARKMIWEANAKAAAASPAVGFGAGTHRWLYPLFLEEPFWRRFTHAESGYLQIASECGLAGLILLVAMISQIGLVVLRGMAQSPRTVTAPLWLAIVPGLIGSICHAGVDFVWYLPGLLSITLTLVGCAIRLEQLQSPEADVTGPLVTRTEWRTPQLGAVVFLSVVAGGFYLGPARAAADLDRYHRTKAAMRGMTREIARGDNPDEKDALVATLEDATRRCCEILGRAVTVDTRNADAHLRLASRLLQLYQFESKKSDTGMSLDLMRDAALNGGFRDYHERLAWLRVVMGPQIDLLLRARRHAEVAARLSPMQGEAYLCLARLDFLDPKTAPREQLVEQALRVRPYDGDVLFEAGRLHWLGGDTERAMRTWAECVRRPGSHQVRLVSLFSCLAPAAVLIEELNPGLGVVELAMHAYRENGSREDLAALCAQAAAEAEKAEANREVPPLIIAHHWRQVSATLRSMGRYEEAISHAEKARRIAGHDFSMRLELATALVAAERYNDAEPHIRWCLARRPDIRRLHTWLETTALRRTQADSNRRRRRRLYDTLARKEAESSEKTEEFGSRQRPLSEMPSSEEKTSLR